jgi:hypothetical protein
MAILLEIGAFHVATGYTGELQLVRALAIWSARRSRKKRLPVDAAAAGVDSA